MTARRDNDGPFSLEISDRPPGDWTDLVSRDPAAEYTHCLNWTDAIGLHQPGAGIFWLSLHRSGRLVGGLNVIESASRQKIPGLPLPFRLMESSFGGMSGGPLVERSLEAAEQDRVFGELVDALAARRPGPLGSCALVLGPVQEERFGPVMRTRARWLRKDAATAMVRLTGGIEQVGRDRLDRTKRKERNRALRSGAEVIITRDVPLLEEYYAIYERAAGHWGIDPVPLSLMKALLQDGDDRVFFTCVRLEGRVIGGHLNLHFGDKVMAWNGVTDPRFARTHYPATLCFWGDMEEACRRGAAWLDLGGSGGLDSLTNFKTYFGAELRMRGLYVQDSPVVGLLKKGRFLWRGRRESSPPDRLHDSIDDAGNREES